MKKKYSSIIYLFKNLTIFLFVIFLGLSMSASHVDTTFAKNIAKNFYFEIASSKSEISYNSLQLSLKQTSLSNDDTIYYVFNINNGGWVIVSAIDNVIPVLAYSLDGSYSAVNQPPAMVEWMNSYKDQILIAKQNNVLQDSSVAIKWIKYSQPVIETQLKASSSVGPLLTTTWDQAPAYNGLCPNQTNPGQSVTGCVATAMGQIMRYWGYDKGYNFPCQGLGSHSYYDPIYGLQSVDFCSTNYDWLNMPTAIDWSNTITEISAVATLLYHCGVSVDMNYNIGSNGGSLAYATNIPTALINYFGYSLTSQYLQKASYSDNNWENLLLNEIDAGRPMEYNGQDPSHGGHSFVCDGYGYNGDYYFHFNWGWGGSSDGYFYISSLNPSPFNFSSYHGAVIGIQPGAYISMYGNYSISPNPIQQGEPLNVTVDLANYGFDNFNGDLYLGLFDQNTGDWVEDIEQLSSEYQSSQTHDTYNFSSTNVTLSPGNYLLCLFYRKTGSSCWIRVPQMLYINPLSVQVTSSPLIANFIASSTSICSGNPVQFTDQSTGNPTSWLWNFGDGYTSTSQSPSHTYNTSGTYTVSLTITKGANNDTETKTNYITVLPLPSIANTPTGTTILCQDATNTSYNTTGATNATSYFWSISPAGVGTISGTGTTATVDWNSTFSGSASINVRGVNSCGNGAWSNTFVVNINPIPSTASTPTGLADLCQNASNTNYTTSGASSATTYEWSITPTGAGTISGTGTTGTVDWNNTYTGSVSIKVRGVNSCGNGQWSNVLAVNINLIPAISPAPIGSTTLCQNASNTVYSTTGTTYSTSYEWSISPSGAGAISGSGLTGSVDWISTFVGTATIKVRGVNSCGNGAWSNTLTVTVNPLPSDAIFPTGSSLLCQNASNTSYNTSGASNATSYLWSIDPSSAGVISGNGTTGIVDWNSSFLGTATIYVTGVNSCGNSLTASSITVIVNPIPTTAATPTGSTSLCQNASNTDYLSAGGTYTSSYVWGINPPSAGMITGNGLIGTVDWNNSFSGSAAITVYGINNCGNGSMSAPLNITINSLPAQPTISNNGNQLTSSASSNYQWYHNASLISGAITHTYTAFHNGSYWVSVSNIYGCSSTSIPFNYYIPSSLPFSPELLTTSGNVDINGNTILSWSIGESIIEINTNTNNILTQGFHQSDYLVTEIDKKEDPNYLIKIFPNPSSDNVTIEITTNIPDVFNLILIDEQGRSLLFQKMSSIEKTKSINLGKYSSGIYILKINSETNKISKSYKIQKIN